MLDPVVITLSLVGALVCFIVFAATNRDFQNYVWGNRDTDDGIDASEPATNGDCK